LKNLFEIGSETMESVKGVLGRWGRRVGEAAMKAESLAGNTWQHREFPILYCCIVNPEKIYYELRLLIDLGDCHATWYITS